MTWGLPRSRGARRRLALLAVSGAVLMAAAGLTLRGLRDSISYFYTPSQAAAHARLGEPIELGGLVETGSVREGSNGDLSFRVGDKGASVDVTYRGSPPDLFREGQGVVASGVFRSPGRFVATRILAKHDERYLPRPLVDALKARGEWRGTASSASATLSSQNAAATPPWE